jgi:hypothetical protein
VLYSTWRLDGSAPLGPWDASTWDTERVGPRPSTWRPLATQLYAVHDDAVAASRTRLTAFLTHGSLDEPVAVAAPDGRRVSLRRLLFDLLEEYGRHTGHADLLRESVDGRVGEDPPPDWRPPAGAGP